MPRLAPKPSSTVAPARPPRVEARRGSEKKLQASDKAAAAGLSAKLEAGSAGSPVPPGKGAGDATRAAVGASPAPIRQYADTFVFGELKSDPAALSRAMAMRVWSPAYEQLRPTDVAPGSPVYGGTLDGGKSKFEVTKQGDERVLRFEASGANGKAHAVVRTSVGDEALSELWITYRPKAAPPLEALEIVTVNGQPMTFMIAGRKVERGAVLDYAEAYGGLGVGDAPNARAILGAILRIPAASPLIYQGGTAILKGLLLDS